MKEFTEEELRNRLTNEEYNVTQEGGTEAPYSGKYYKETTPGMYKCVVCGERLFDSKTKFDSGTGWPSFFDPAEHTSVKLTPDNSLFMKRTEVSCAECGAHLGHVFDDALDTPTGKRYCINSASLNLEENEEN